MPVTADELGAELDALFDEEEQDADVDEGGTTKALCTPKMILAKSGILPASPPNAPPAQVTMAAAGAGATSSASGALPGVAVAPDVAAVAPPLATLGAGALILADNAPAVAAGNGHAAPPNYEQMFKEMRQLCIQMESRLRFLEGILISKFSMVATVLAVVNTLAALANYNRVTLADPRGHTLGPPHPHLLLAFLTSLVRTPLPQGTDEGVRGRMLVMMLLLTKMSTMTGAEVDEFAPYFCIFSVQGADHTSAALAGKVFICFHIRGTANIPTGADVDDLAARATQAIATNNPASIMGDISRSFVFTDGIPVAAQPAGALEISRMLGTIICSTGGTRPVGRAPPGGPVRKLKKGKGKGAA